MATGLIGGALKFDMKLIKGVIKKRKTLWPKLTQREAVSKLNVSGDQSGHQRLSYNLKTTENKCSHIRV